MFGVENRVQSIQILFNIYIYNIKNFKLLLNLKLNNGIGPKPNPVI